MKNPFKDFKPKWQHFAFFILTLFYLGFVDFYYSIVPIAGLLVALIFIIPYLLFMYLIRSTMGRRTIWRRVYIHDRFPPWYRNLSYRPRWQDPPKGYVNVCNDNNIIRLPGGWIPSEGNWSLSLRFKRNLERLSIFPAGLVICETLSPDIDRFGSIPDISIKRALHYRHLFHDNDNLIMSPELFEYRRKHNIPQEMYKASKRASRNTMGIMIPIIIIMIVGVVIYIALKFLGLI